MSGGRLSWLKICLPAAIIFTGLIGPLYFVLRGEFEWLFLYGLAVTHTPEYSGWNSFLTWHLIFALLSPVLMVISARLRGYHNTSLGEARGRFPLKKTLY